MGYNVRVDEAMVLGDGGPTRSDDAVGRVVTREALFGAEKIQTFVRVKDSGRALRRGVLVDSRDLPARQWKIVPIPDFPPSTNREQTGKSRRWKNFCQI